MDGTHFDQLIKRLATTPVPRATVLRGLVATAAALTGVTLGAVPEETEGRKLGNVPRKRICDCANERAESCNQRKVIKKKAKKILKRNDCAYRGRCTGVSGCAGAGPGVTCSDGIKNGSETDIDCGGSCPRCSDGQVCQVANDCISGTCAATNRCVACTPTQTCGSDAQGQCRCDRAFPSDAPVCNKVEALGLTVDDCAKCPAGTETCVTINGLLFNCYKRCGSP